MGGLRVGLRKEDKRVRGDKTEKERERERERERGWWAIRKMMRRYIYPRERLPRGIEL